MNVSNRQKIEKKIATAIVNAAISNGYSVSVDNGEEVVIDKSTDKKAIIKEMFTVDEERLNIYKNGKYVGMCFLVYGNDGWDVLADYSIALEDMLRPVNALIDEEMEVAGV